MDGPCSMHGKDGKCVKNFQSEYLKGTDHSEDLRRRCEDNIRMDVREVGWEGMDCMDLAQDWDQ
jgi:hypothetical protein